MALGGAARLAVAHPLNRRLHRPLARVGAASLVVERVAQHRRLREAPLECLDPLRVRTGGGREAMEAAAPPGFRVHYDFTVSPADDYMPHLLERLSAFDVAGCYEDTYLLRPTFLFT